MQSIIKHFNFLAILILIIFHERNYVLLLFPICYAFQNTFKNINKECLNNSSLNIFANITFDVGIYVRYIVVVYIFVSFSFDNFCILYYK
jgi:hypothetical protein